MTFPNERPILTETTDYSIEIPKTSGWVVRLFGSKANHGMHYYPPEGTVPNFFIRWMMKVCLGCTWEKLK